MSEWDAVREAIAAGERLRIAVNAHSNDLARLLRGNLHRVNHDYLAALKRELRGFNIHTGRWK